MNIKERIRQSGFYNGRYVLLNAKTNCAVTYGDDFGTMCVEARKYHAITGDPYRVYNSEAGRNVYWWPAEQGKTV